MKKIIGLLIVSLFVMMCQDKESNFEEKRRAELLLLYLKDEKDKQKVCLEVMQKSKDCLQKSKDIPDEAKDGDSITEETLSKFTSKQLEFEEQTQFSEFCKNYSKKFFPKTSEQAQACVYSCDKKFWSNKQDDNQCEVSYMGLFTEGFLVKNVKTKDCIERCFSFLNTKIRKDSLKDLSTYDFFKLIRKKNK